VGVFRIVSLHKLTDATSVPYFSLPTRCWRTVFITTTSRRSPRLFREATAGRSAGALEFPRRPLPCGNMKQYQLIASHRDVHRVGIVGLQPRMPLHLEFLINLVNFISPSLDTAQNIKM